MSAPVLDAKIVVNAAFVAELVAEYENFIAPRLAEDASLRYVTLVFASANDLAKRLAAGNSGSVGRNATILFSTLTDERKKQPDNVLLQQVDSSAEFCVAVATMCEPQPYATERLPLPRPVSCTQ